MRFRVTTLTFSDNTNISLADDAVVVFVGPNNAGKSQVLKDVLGHARDANYQGRAVSTLTFDKSVPTDVGAWMTENLPAVERQGVKKFAVDGWGDVGEQDILGQWAGERLAILTPAFILYADGTSRLSAGNAPSAIDLLSQSPTHPIQRAYADPELEMKLSAESMTAFGVPISVDRYAGSTIPLRVGPRPMFEHNEGAPTANYVESLRKLPTLEQQGDGVRSYLGLLLHVLAGAQQVVLIDEPEAFLHPPQARLLGQTLAEKTSQQQTVIATHSSDVLQGLLSSGSPVTIVRLMRTGNVNTASVLAPDAVKELWSDPLLRYSNVLDGLFHDAVVLCEGDADCRYYSAVLDGLASTSTTSEKVRSPDFLFTHCGGKARLASVTRALRAVSVPVTVVADFDVLKSKVDVERIVTALGGDFATVESDLNVLDAALKADTKPLQRITLKDALNGQIETSTETIVAKEELPKLRALLRADDGWEKAKRAGQGAVPQGEAYAAALRLLESLQGIGLHVVPVGELERFVPEVGGHGPGWVSEVLEQGLHLRPTTTSRTFVQGLLDAHV